VSIFCFKEVIIDGGLIVTVAEFEVGGFRLTALLIKFLEHKFQ
jgi:hypothetical protein